MKEKFLKEIKTLAMLKMEKNFRAHNDKGYLRQPYKAYNLEFWIKRASQEFLELLKEIKNKDYGAIRAELADISNIVDYAFERSFIEENDKANAFPDNIAGEKQLFEHDKRSPKKC